MVSSAAKSVDAYLAELPLQRRTVVSTVRDMVNAHIPPGYEEGMAYGMIGWSIPLSRYPVTYNKQPLSYAALAAQKAHYALYLNCIDAGSEREDRLRLEFEEAGKRLDMGKSCVRFKAIDDLALDAIGRVIAGTPVDEFIARYEASRRGG